MRLGYLTALQFGRLFQAYAKLFLGEMRGEEKPYEMPSPNDSQQSQQQQQQPHNSNLAIQQRLQHLSPINPQKLSRQHKNQLKSADSLPGRSSIQSGFRSVSPASAASTMSNQSTSSSSMTPPLGGGVAGSILPHPLDSLLTPAASPEDDSLETWIQTV